MSEEEPAIRAQLGKVLIPHRSLEEGWVDEECTPDEARHVLRELIAAINVAEEQVVAIRAACADGHLWGDGWNFTIGDKRTVYHCTRDGCEATKYEPGWLPFEPKQHYVPFASKPLDCTGPGCHYCDEEAMADTFRKFMDDAFMSIPRVGAAFIAEPNTASP